MRFCNGPGFVKGFVNPSRATSEVNVFVNPSPATRTPSAGVVLLFGVGARPPPDGV